MATRLQRTTRTMKTMREAMCKKTGCRALAQGEGVERNQRDSTGIKRRPDGDETGSWGAKELAQLAQLVPAGLDD
ncbi:hypothetical protein E4U55_003272 [Claviceps digitariae]|nr:hypothetical protein E4U55_003272 [Claviceps digitariae]